MKALQRALVAVWLLVLCPGAAMADGAASSGELAQKVEQALKAKDATAMAALYNWDRVAPDIKSQLQEAVESMVGDPVRKVELRPLPGDFEPVQELGDQCYVQNVKAEGVVTLIYSLEDDSAIATMPYGAKNGRYYLSAPVMEKCPGS